MQNILYTQGNASYNNMNDDNNRFYLFLSISAKTVPSIHVIVETT